MKAATYESDITPPLGCYQTGYGYPRYAQDVYHKLFAKSLVVEDNGNCAVIISIDICEYPREMTDIITKRIFEYTGIPAENICIHSTHTHFGASVLFLHIKDFKTQNSLLGRLKCLELLTVDVQF